MKYASFFSGIGGFELALDAAGHERVFSCEIEKFCNEIMKDRYGNEHDARDITKLKPEEIPDADIWVGGFPCLSGDTPVLTHRGYVAIAEVRKGDAVLTHQSRWRTVLASAKTGTRETVRVKIAGSAELRCTPDHRFRAVRKRQVWDNDRRRYVRAFSEPAWVAAKDLTGEHYVAQPVPREAPPVPLPLTAQMLKADTKFWRFVGLYLGDGWLVEHARTNRPAGQVARRVLVCANPAQEDAVREMLPRPATRSAERTTVKFTFQDIPIFRLLREFGQYSHGKFLPGWIHALPHGSKAALLEGYKFADGSDYKGGWRATTVSPMLAHGLATLAREVYGRGVSLHRSRLSPRREVEGRDCAQRDQFGLVVPPKNRVTVKINEMLWARVSSTTPHETEDVYDLEVEEDSSFVAQGCAVHNCQDLSVAGKRGGIKANRSGLVWQFLKLAAVRRPRWCLLENVPGLLSSSGGADFGLLCPALADLWDDVGWTVLDAQHFGVPQRRRRVFLVGGFGAGRVAQVLFEPAGRSGHHPPRREAGPRTAAESARCVGGAGGGQDPGAGKGNVVQDRASAITASAGHHGHSSPRGDGSDNIVPQAVTAKWAKNTSGPSGDECHNLVADDKKEPKAGVSKGAESEPGARDGQDDYLLVEGDSASSTPDKPRLRAGCGRGGETYFMKKPPVPEGEPTAYHRNASCKVTDQKGKAAALKAQGEHSYQFVTAPENAATLRSRQHREGVNPPGRGGEEDQNLVVEKEKAQKKGEAICIQDVRGTGREGVNDQGKVASSGSDRDTGMGVREDGKSYTLGAVDRHAVAFDANNNAKDKTGTLVSGGKRGRNDMNLPMVAHSADVAPAVEERYSRTGNERTEAERLVVEGEKGATAEDWRKKELTQLSLFPAEEEAPDSDDPLFIDPANGGANQNPVKKDGKSDSIDTSGPGAVAIHSDATRGCGGKAKKPSPDAEGKVRLRDPGMGIGEDDKQFTLNASAPHAVAYEEKKECLTPWDSTTKRIHDAEGKAPTVAGSDGKGGQRTSHVAVPEGKKEEEAVAFVASEQMNSYSKERDQSFTVNAQPPSDSSNVQYGVRKGMAVRRLTPTEAERLQGFPDGWSCKCGERPDCPDRRVPSWVDASTFKLGGCGHSLCGCKCPDGARYRALGNAVAVPVIRWIAERLKEVE